MKTVLKTVYFVRHGESTANAGFPTYQGETSELTEKGIEQARFIAKRCKKLHVDGLIASTAMRARQTAEYIADEIGRGVEVNELFTERRLPNELVGRPRSDPDAQAMEDAWLKSFFQTNIRIGGGENFSLLKARVASALDYLRDRPEEHILVVTHGFFLHMVVALVLLRETMSAEEFEKVAPAVWMDNTGITRVEFRDEVLMRTINTRYRGWILRVWNDHVHLG